MPNNIGKILRPHSPISRQSERGLGTPRSKIVTLTPASKFSLDASSITKSTSEHFKQWLEDLALLDYYDLFIAEGFRMPADFNDLTREDMSGLFPFLKMGDLLRLSKHIANESSKK